MPQVFRPWYKHFASDFHDRRFKILARLLHLDSHQALGAFYRVCDWCLRERRRELHGDGWLGMRQLGRLHKIAGIRGRSARRVRAAMTLAGLFEVGHGWAKIADWPERCGLRCVREAPLRRAERREKDRRERARRRSALARLEASLAPRKPEKDPPWPANVIRLPREKCQNLHNPPLKKCYAIPLRDLDQVQILQPERPSEAKHEVAVPSPSSVSSRERQRTALEFPGPPCQGTPMGGCQAGAPRGFLAVDLTKVIAANLRGGGGPSRPTPPPASRSRAHDHPSGESSALDRLRPWFSQPKVANEIARAREASAPAGDLRGPCDPADDRGMWDKPLFAQHAVGRFPPRRSRAGSETPRARSTSGPASELQPMAAILPKRVVQAAEELEPGVDDESYWKALLSEQPAQSCRRVTPPPTAPKAPELPVAPEAMPTPLVADGDDHKTTCAPEAELSEGERKWAELAPLGIGKGGEAFVAWLRARPDPVTPKQLERQRRAEEDVALRERTRRAAAAILRDHAQSPGGPI